jgi:hypothetical protein
VTSAANPHYQKDFDRLFDLAKAGDWDGVRNYEVKGDDIDPVAPAPRAAEHLLEHPLQVP